MEYNWALAGDIREGKIETPIKELFENGLAGLITGFGISQIPDSTGGLAQGAAATLVGGYPVMGREVYNRLKYNLPPTSAIIKGAPNDIAFLVGGAVGMGLGHIEKIIPAIQKYF